MLHILHNSLLSNRLLDPALRLDIKGISIKCLDFALLSELPIPRLSKQFSKSSRVRLGRCCNLGLCLRLSKVRLFHKEMDRIRTSWSWRMRLGSPRICSLIISESCSIVLSQ